MDKLITNIEHGVPFQLAELIDYKEGKIESISFAKNAGVGIILLAFDKEQIVATHTVPVDEMIIVLDGEAEITIDGNVNNVGAGQVIVMPAGIPHSVKAVKRFKMLLSVVKNTEGC